MVYHFNEEDFGLRMEWIFLGVDTHIMLFLHLHEDIVRSAYDELIAELKKAENETNTCFIENLKYEEFQEVSDFVFRVRLAKHMRRKAQEMRETIAKTPNGEEIFTLTCIEFAKKLYFEHDKEENIELVRNNVKNLCEQLKEQFDAMSRK